VRPVRVIVPVLAALVAMLLVASAATAAPAPAAYVHGLEYAATSTEGRFGGAAKGRLPGAWIATVVHDQLRPGRAAPITGGSFTLYGGRGPTTGTFVDGNVTPLTTPAACLDERFNVAGTLALSGGGKGSFKVVLTHLRTPTRHGCKTYGATVAGTLTLASRAAA
jgi:hypothetical protein